MSAGELTTTSLMGQVSEGLTWARVTLMGRSDDDRQVWAYVVSVLGEGTSGDDLRTGVGADETPQSMLRTLAGFLEAHAESSPDGENAGLFEHEPWISDRVADVIRNELGWEGWDDETN